MRCETFRSQLRSYLEEELEGDGRVAWREHLQSCVECRRFAVAEEPSLLLAGLPTREVELRRVEDCATAVAAMIRQERLARRLRPDPRPWLAAAAALLLVTAGGVAWRLAPPTGSPQGAPPATPVVAAMESPQHLPPPQVEVDMQGEDVRIYHFANQDDTDTAVLFIVNPALES